LRLDACERPSCLQLLQHRLFDQEERCNSSDSAVSDGVDSRASPLPTAAAAHDSLTDLHSCTGQQLPNVGPNKTPSQKVRHRRNFRGYDGRVPRLFKVGVVLMSTVPPLVEAAFVQISRYTVHYVHRNTRLSLFVAMSRSSFSIILYLSPTLGRDLQRFASERVAGGRCPHFLDES